MLFLGSCAVGLGGSLGSLLDERLHIGKGEVVGLGAARQTGVGAVAGDVGAVGAIENLYLGILVEGAKDADTLLLGTVSKELQRVGQGEGDGVEVVGK